MTTDQREGSDTNAGVTSFTAEPGRLDIVVGRRLGVPRADVQRAIARGLVLVDGRPRAKSHRLAGGERVEAGLLGAGNKLAPEPGPLSIPYQDDHLVVVSKPAGLVTHPTVARRTGTLVNRLLSLGIPLSGMGGEDRPGIVHRLDAGTSGLMVVAKSELAYSVLKQAFRSRAVEKTYHALIQGHPDPFTGTIDAPIGRHPGADYKMAITTGGRPSITHYETLEAFVGTTLLEVNLETGRTHQIRVHFAALRHPCVGDIFYGADPVLADRLGLERQWLHAVRLAFTHPVTGEPMSFSSPYPADLRRALDIVQS